MESIFKDDGEWGVKNLSFVDSDNRPCVVVDSVGLRSEPILRIGRRESQMYLNMEICKQLYPLLKEFSEKGELL